MIKLKKINYTWLVCGLLLCWLYAGDCFAQAQAPQQGQVQPIPLQLQPPHPAAKMVQRMEIDAKRMGVNINGEDALPRSREFKRIDSSYYVGWMFEGAYKYNHAADYLGFKNASVPLEHALNLIERDYHKALSTRAKTIIEYYPVYKFDIDYTLIALYLMNCYSNMEEPEKVYTLLQRVLKWNFQRDFYMDAYNYLGWTVHRNRFYTSDKYPFLKNSIAANEKLANWYLDQGLKKIARDKKQNAQIFKPGYEIDDLLAVDHYKSILYSYALNIDSAEHYYNLLRAMGNAFPHNNYATFRASCGDFRTAESEYQKASQQDPGDKRLQEWVYYSSIIDIYKSQPKEGIVLTKDQIRAAGSTPGFGWYNIALARCMFYDGQIEESARYADKAAGFKELHIGTTLGQTQYDFSIQLIKLLDKEADWQKQKFENRNWWYNPKVLANMVQLESAKYLQQFLIINQFSQNPERDLVIYKLFSTESTVSWDEIWYLIKDFSTNFFLEKFKKQEATDDRKYVHKYFSLFVAMLDMKKGDYTAAREKLDEILQQPNTDMDYEKLFIARVLQAEAECAKHRDDMTAYNKWLYRMYQVYPQLMPFTGMQPNMHLHISGEVDQAVVERLKACNINWVDDSNIPAPEAYVIFSHSGKRKDIRYYVLDQAGNTIVKSQAFAYQQPDEAAVSVAYRLFDIGGKLPEKQEDKQK